MLVRDASTEADAVYFNPAGLIKLNDGFHFSLNSQTIFQSKDVTSNYQFLSGSPKKFEGEVKAPVFPGLCNLKISGSFWFNLAEAVAQNSSRLLLKKALPIWYQSAEFTGTT
jgi:hypothetical protein